MNKEEFDAQLAQLQGAYNEAESVLASAEDKCKETESDIEDLRASLEDLKSDIIDAKYDVSDARRAVDRHTSFGVRKGFLPKPSLEDTINGFANAEGLISFKDVVEALGHSRAAFFFATAKKNGVIRKTEKRGVWATAEAPAQESELPSESQAPAAGDDVASAA